MASLLFLAFFAECCVCSGWVQYAFDFSSIWVSILIYTYVDCLIRGTSIYNPRIQSGGDFVPLSCRRKVTEWALFMMMCCPCHGFSLSLSISPWHFSSPARAFLLVSLLLLSQWWDFCAVGMYYKSQIHVVWCVPHADIRIKCKRVGSIFRRHTCLFSWLMIWE